MNPHCECPIAGWCKRHQMVKSRGFHERCRGIAPNRDCGRSFWIAFEQGRFGATAPENPILNPDPFCDGQQRQKSTVGTRLEQVIEDRTGRKIECEDCRQRVQSLNLLSIDEVSQAKETIVADIETRISKVGNMVERVLVAADKLLHTGITHAAVGEWLEDAIELAQRDEVPRPKKARPAPVRAGRVAVVGKKARKPYTGWRGEQDGPRLYLGPFESTIRHLTYHVWPTTPSYCWQWNLEQLAKRWKLFNGTKCLGIVTDEKTETSDVVLKFCDLLGMRFDHVIVRPNNPRLREVVTWIPMLDCLKPRMAGPTEVVFSAHAKGAQYDQEDFTRDWCDLMYQSCLDYWPAVETNLKTSLMTGSFREFGLLGKWNDWAYSGTFFWWRLQEIGKRDWRNVDQWFAGTESWPGKLCDPKETTCLFLNNNTRLYEPDYWKKVVWPEWEKWQEKMRYQRNAH